MNDIQKELDILRLLAKTIGFIRDNRDRNITNDTGLISDLWDILEHYERFKKDKTK